MYAAQRFVRNGKACDTFSVCPYLDICSYVDPDAIRARLDFVFGEPQPFNFKPWFTINLELG
jgi:hypothetical protein